LGTSGRGLLHILFLLAQAEITRQVNGLARSQKHALSSISGRAFTTGGSTKFLAVAQPVLPSGPQLTTNVRVAASAEPFPTVVAMVEDSVCVSLSWLCDLGVLRRASVGVACRSGSGERDMLPETLHAHLSF
jgi:hypothetical protein